MSEGCKMNILPPHINVSPCILLKRLTEEEIERFTSIKRKKKSSSNKPRELSDTIKIKQERPDIPTINVQQENQNDQIQTIGIKQENQNGQNVTTKPCDQVNTSHHQSIISRTTIENGTRLTIRPESNKNLNIRFEDTDVREIKIELDDVPDANDNTTNYYAINLKKLYCENCAVAFNTNEEYVLHNYFNHKNDKSYNCELCEEKFSLKIHLNQHLTQHVRDLCLKPSSSTLPAETQSSPNGDLAMNMRNNINCGSSVTLTNNYFHTNLGEKREITKNRLPRSTKNYCKTNSLVVIGNKPNLNPFKCTECLYSTVDHNQFISHSSFCPNDTNTKPYCCCHLCFKKFRNQSALNGHMKYHSFRGEMISRKQKTEIGNKETNSSVMITQKVIRVTNTNNFFTCKYCSKKFNTNHKLHIHHLQHKKQLVCKVCNQQFFFKKSFEKHLLLHKSGILTVKGNKRRHKKIIKTKFVSNTTGNKTQNNVILFSCAYCKNAYNSEKVLKRHTTMMHPDLLDKNSKSAYQQCNWCSAVITKCNLLRHVRKIHPKVKPIKCQVCSMRFKDNFSMKSHVSKSHPK